MKRVNLLMIAVMVAAIVSSIKRVLRHSCFALLAACFIFNGCFKDIDDFYPSAAGMSRPKAGDVYAVGNIDYNGERRGVIWKNGNGYMLESVNSVTISSEAHSVFVSGNDVYVVGEDDCAVLWKNGVKTELSDVLSSYASSVFVSGNDVYVAGTVNSKVVLWKNGVATELPYDYGNYASASNLSVFVSGNDVYVAGTVSGNAVLWKNGIPTKLSTNESQAHSIFVSGNNVYVAGWVRPTKSSSTKAILWKNGVATELSENGEAYSVFVSGNDVYVTGFDRDRSGVTKHWMWKNGVVTELPDGCGSYALFVSGNDWYLPGYYRAGTNNKFNDLAALFKNGAITKLEAPKKKHFKSWVDSIFVVE